MSLSPRDQLIADTAVDEAIRLADKHSKHGADNWLSYANEQVDRFCAALGGPTEELIRQQALERVHGVYATRCRMLCEY